MTLYSILIDCIANWQSVAHDAQERIYKESINLASLRLYFSSDSKDKCSSRQPSINNNKNDQEGYQSDFKSIGYRQEDQAFNEGMKR